MHISCSYDMSYVITFDIWEVRIMTYYLILKMTAECWKFTSPFFNKNFVNLSFHFTNFRVVVYQAYVEILKYFIKIFKYDGLLAHTCVSIVHVRTSYSLVVKEDENKKHGLKFILIIQPPDVT